MKNIVTFINEELDSATLKKIAATRLNNKKEALLAIKKGLGENDETQLKALAEKLYSEIGNYKDTNDLWDALDAGDVEGWKEVYDKITSHNQNKDVDVNIIIDVIEKIAGGMSLDAAIAEMAKKL